MIYDIEKYHPINLDDLIRLGNKFDGGYVISKRQIQKTDILLSFGVNDDWSFEIDFERIKHVKIFAYDYSVSKSCKYNELRDNIGCMLGYVLVLRRSKVKETWRRIKKIIEEQNKLYGYFQKKHDKCFIPKYLDEHDDDKNISFNSIFNELKCNNELSIFIKMDIEGAEYRTLPHLMPYFDKINGIVVEFHELDKPDKFEEISDLLLKYFYVAHVHANNYGGHIINSMLPKVIEITFINKNMLSKENKLSSHDYPLKGFDFPNDRTLDDIKILFNKKEM
jgi:hypothetical protein